MSELAKILLVENFPHDISLLFNHLKEEPFEVFLAKHGFEALELTKRIHPDLILINLSLPDMNGFKLCGKIKELKPFKDIPILFISGNIEFLESIKDLKQNDIFISHQAKPCNNKDYINSINELILLNESQEETI